MIIPFIFPGQSDEEKTSQNAENEATGQLCADRRAVESMTSTPIATSKAERQNPVDLVITHLSRL